MLLYLDEWTESLDETASQRLIYIVKKMQSEGATIILVSHDIHIVQALADFVVMILGGQIYNRLTKEQIAADDFLVEFLEKGMEE
jgi:ABC-type glutathione transport system ATPase component